jgi:hypothetical protein
MPRVPTVMNVDSKLRWGNQALGRSGTVRSSKSDGEGGPRRTDDPDQISYQGITRRLTGHEYLVVVLLSSRRHPSLPGRRRGASRLRNDGGEIEEANEP